MSENFLQINGDQYRYRKGRCDDCGFTKGTAANLSGVTEIKAKLCAEVPTPFLCHAGAIVENDQLAIPDGKEVLCQGWVDECNRLNAEGFYQREPEWRSKIKLGLTDIITEIENGGMSEAEIGPHFERRMGEILASKNHATATISPSKENEMHD